MLMKQKMHVCYCYVITTITTITITATTTTTTTTSTSIYKSSGIGAMPEIGDVNCFCGPLILICIIFAALSECNIC